MVKGGFKRLLYMAISSEWLSRKLGYGFSFDEKLSPPDKWIENARNQVTSIPNFDPWRLIAKNPEEKNFEKLDIPTFPFVNSDQLSKKDLRYPINLGQAVNLYKQGVNEEERLRKLNTKSMNKNSPDLSKKVAALNSNYIRYHRFPWLRDTVTRGIDNILGSSPVFNRFWHFWINHFSLNKDDCRGELFGNYYLTLRSNLNKKFEDLLFEAIWHPAMQQFLQNSQSVGPNSKSAKWSRESGDDGPTSINENLAREMLELYTVTPSAGYTQADVTAAVYILTGWGSFWPNEHSSRYFNSNRSEPGIFSVLGKSYDDTDLERRLPALCRDLARHPMTAKNIARKLAQHFISDNAPEESIKEIEKTFIKSGGSLIAVHQAVIDQVVKAGPSYRKFMAPALWFWQIHRASRYFPPVFIPSFNELLYIDDMLFEIGQLHSRSPQPNGWSDSDHDWITPEYLERRIRYANRLAVYLSRDEQFDPKAYVERLHGTEENLVNLVRRSDSYKTACNILFCSYQFLEV